MKLLLLAAVLAVSVAGASEGAAAAAGPSICPESQDWWSPIAGLPDTGVQGHLHMNVCIPTGTISGIVEIPVVVTAHDNLAHLNLLKFQDDHGDGQQVIRMDFDLANDAPFAYTFRIDTAKLQNGWRQMRFYAQAQHANGNLQVARPVLPMQVAGSPRGTSNAKGASQYRPTTWYKEANPLLDWGYLVTAIDRVDLPVGTPVPATWCPTIQIARNDKGSSPPVATWRIVLDPAFHAGNPGIAVKSGSGPFKGDVCAPIAGLAAGDHRLVVVVDQFKGDRHHSGVGAFPFVTG